MCPTVQILLLFTGFIWSSYTAEFHDPHCGGRTVIVHLFEWKWTDIANECEKYLGPKGFCGVQVSPPMEHVMVTTDGNRPWWERYQPVSYKLVSRSGNEEQFKDMVARCKAVGVRIFVDAVINHMAGRGRNGTGTAGSTFISDTLDFPSVPYTAEHFHKRIDCPSHDGNVNNYGDPKNVRNCDLFGLTDLDGSQAYVQEKVADYFNYLISLGVAGFHVDVAMHMWPADISSIQDKTDDLLEGGRPFFVLEVIDRNDGAVKGDEYFDLGWVTEFRYVQKVWEDAADLTDLGRGYAPGWDMIPTQHAFVFVDNQDTQRGNHSLSYKDGEEYKRAVAFTLANDYGFTRVLSSYDFTNNDEGPPHNDDYSTKDVTINANGTCGNGWVCEHRWSPIGNMAMFRNAVAGTKTENLHYDNGVLTLNRGDKGFFAMSVSDFNITINTGLPAGEYCDLISECAKKISVDGSGNAQVSPHNPAEPFVAIITKGGENIVTPAPQTTSQPSGTQGVFARTVIMFEKVTKPGEDLFIRGGSTSIGCSGDATTSSCSIPIKFRGSGTGPHYEKINAWSIGDNFLDWSGPEPNQGTYGAGLKPEGTPAFWSTSVKTEAGYSDLNKYGPHYWIVDVDMDCSKTENGFFEVSAVLNNNVIEVNIAQSAACTGGGGGASNLPHNSTHHIGKCGFINVFHFANDDCEIVPFQ